MNIHSIARSFWYKLSSKQRFIIRRLYYLPNDFNDFIFKRKHKYVPPRGLIYTGSPASASKYIEQGTIQLQLLINEIELKNDDSVLDIGCGIGRTAVALTTYLNENGSYEGFDVVKTGVDWCINKIHKDFANFNFQYIPLFNDLYNNSKLKACDFTFPYPANTFDKVFTFSVFTHMQVDEIQHYFQQINRVIKPKGLIFSTFFLYDNATEEWVSTNKNFNFPIKKDGFRFMNSEVKSGNIAIHKNKLKEIIEVENLKIIKIIDGFWKDTTKDSNKLEFQDIVIAQKL